MKQRIGSFGWVTAMLVMGFALSLTSMLMLPVSMDHPEIVAPWMPITSLLCGLVLFAASFVDMKEAQ